MEKIKNKESAFRRIFSTVGSVLNSVRISTKNDKNSWLKRTLPKPIDSNTKQQGEAIPLAFGLPPAEALVGKTLAYGALDPGFTGLVATVNDYSQAPLVPRSKYELPSDIPSKELGFRWNGWGINKLQGLGSSQGHQGNHLRNPVERATDRNSQEHGGHSLPTLPNTSPLTKDELSNIIPFRNYTFYSDFDVDKFAGYKSVSVLSSNHEDVVSLAVSSELLNGENIT